jgi:hypothetical protein
MKMNGMYQALVLAAMTACLPARAGVEVRVGNSLGGPVVLVNGKPLALRCFYGTRRRGLCRTTGEWRQFSFDFNPAHAVAGRGTLHFRFGKKPNTYFLRTVRIVDTRTGADVLSVKSFADPAVFADVWNVWPPGERNTVGAAGLENGALKVVMKAPPHGAWPDFHLHTDISLRFEKGITYRCSFSARSLTPGEVRPAVYAVEGGVWEPIGGPVGVFARELALVRDAGVPFVSTQMLSCWRPPGETPDWGPVDRVMKRILQVYPQALILPRVSANAPPWWLERHPETRMRYDDGSRGRCCTPSSVRYRKEAAAHIEALCRHLRAAFPNHFAGIHPAGQNTGEWFYDRSWEAPLSGYDPTTRDAWRKWLAVQGDPGAATAEVPGPKARRDHSRGLLLNPATRRRIVLFNRFRQEEMAALVTTLARGCRRGAGEGRLVVFFYGYLFEFPPLRNGAPYSGHYALNRVLACRDIDVLCSPISYFDRQWQGTGACMSVAESVMLHGKLWLNEDDTRTWLAHTTRYGGVADLAQTRAVLLRNTAQASLRGFGTWWMDLAGTGWYNDARIWDVHKELRPLDQAMLKRTKPFSPEVAAIVGEDSMIHLAAGSSAMARPLVYVARSMLGRMGAPYGQYLLRDAVAGKVPARLQFYLSAWALSAEQVRKLRENRRPGVTRVWCYAPGYVVDDVASVENMSRLSGFTCRPARPGSARSIPTAAGRELGLAEAWGREKSVQPLFAVKPEPGDRVLAVYDDGSPSLVVRESGRGRDVFLGTPALTSKLTRTLARLAGVHLYTEVDAGVWAAENYLSVHTMAAGPLKLNTGAPAEVVDVLTGKTLGRGPLLRLDVAAGQTLVLKIGSATANDNRTP